MKVLLLIDIQQDFLPGGALAVPQGDQIIPIVNRLVPHFPLVVATQDWHPAHHGSFAANHLHAKVGQVVDLNGLEQILWPVHCVQDTEGANFPADLQIASYERVFQKGTDPSVDSYSGFYDNGHQNPTGLADYLRQRGGDTLYVAGLATDYCVKFTVLDALAEGFPTYVITDATRGVNRQPGDTERAFSEMAEAGAHLITSEALRSELTASAHS